MIETLFKNPMKAKTHLLSPRLQERESFLKVMKQKGLCLRSLQMAADYLLFAVHTLDLNDNNGIVRLEDIVSSGEFWKDKKSKFYVSTVVKWLYSNKMLDLRYCDNGIVFNSFSTKCHYRLRYLTYPLYQERLVYLEYLKDNGAAFSTLREHAETQLAIIDKLNIRDKRLVTKVEIEEAILKTKTDSERNHSTISAKWIKNFKSVAHDWLQYAKMLSEDNSSFPPEADLVSRYIQWAKEAKGLANPTLEGRERELLSFVTYVHQRNLSVRNLEIYDVDEYVGYRHNCGCGRRSLATIVTTLRDFAKYAYIRGCCKNLAPGMRSPKQFSLETLPSAPSWETVNVLVKHYGTSDVRGKRNTAIISMMAIYGMRSSEVANLKLKDIDWDKELIYLHRAKRGGLQSFPLMPEVGNLIADYLRNGRNNELGRDNLFLTLFMPYKNISKNCIYNIVSQAYGNLDVSIKHKGGHSLRHACASHLINNGSSLKEISDLLGHRLFDTTRIYAKVDINNLRSVAEINWEGVI
jgi:Site-specific recombinase XerD